MLLQAFYSGFPQSTKVGSTLRDELPINASSDTIVRDHLLCLLFTEEVVELFQLTSCSYEVGTIITPHGGGLATACDKSSEGGDECFGC